MGGKRWTNEEHAVLADIAVRGQFLSENMHRLPGRSFDGAKQEASRIGVSFLKNSTWSPVERATLRRIYRGKESVKAGVARLLPHRGYLAAKGEAQRLGLSAQRRGREGYSWVEIAVVAALDERPRMTVKQLAAATGASTNAVDKVLNRKRGTKFRVGDWTRTSVFGDWAGLWEVGAGPDAERPVRKSSSQSAREWRERKRLVGGVTNPFLTVMRQVSA